MHRLDLLRAEVLDLLASNPPDQVLADKIFLAVQESPTIPIPWGDPNEPPNLGAVFRTKLRKWCHEPASEAERERFNRRNGRSERP